jgi:prepilin-type N-terminal cleavage/methylation domain-containing protein
MKSNRRGFTLVEILFAMILISVFFAVAERVMHSVMIGFEQLPKAQDAIAVNNSVLQTLRSDVWNASAIEMKSDKSVLITNDSGSSTWSIDADDIVRAGAGDATRRWLGAGKTVRFEADPVGLKLSPKDVVPITIASQFLIEKARPR